MPVELLDSQNISVGTYGSLQAAVDAASDNFTIRLDAGMTLREQVVIEGLSGLTIEGNGATIEMPDGFTFSHLSGVDGGSRDRAAVITVRDGDVDISDLTVDGRGLGDDMPGAVTGGARTDFEGILYFDASGTVDGVSVVAVRDAYNGDGTVSGNQRGNGVIAVNDDGAARTFTFQNGTIEDFQKNAINGYGAGLTFEVIDSVITGAGFLPADNAIAQNGIQVSDGALGVITGNTIQEIGYQRGDWVTTGVLTFGAPTGTVISGNTFVGATDGSGVTQPTTHIPVYVSGETDGVVVTNNTFDGTVFGIALASNVDDPDYSGNVFTNQFDSVTEITNGGTWTKSQLELYGSNNDLPLNITGLDGDDYIVGTDFDDAISGGRGMDYISGGTGNDLLDGEENPDTIDGGAGNDTLIGGGNSDVLDGGDDDDLLEGGLGGDSMSGGAGDDTLVAFQDDTIDGGEGTDLLQLSDLAGLTGAELVSLLSGTPIDNPAAPGATLGLSLDGAPTGADLEASISVTDGSVDYVFAAGVDQVEQSATDIEIISVPGAGSSTFLVVPGMSIADAIAAADEGDTILLSAGTHVLPGQLNIDKGITIAGVGEGLTTIETSDSAYGLHVITDEVTLQDFTLDATALTTPGGFGIKVAPYGGATALTGFSAQDITVFGAARSEIDLNGVDDSSLVRVTANGDAGNGADGDGATAGVGISMSDSTGITLEDVTTLNNSWGSIGLYSAGRSFDADTSGVTFSGSYTHGEAVGIYADEELLGEERTAVENVDFSEIYSTVYKVQNSAFRDGSDGRSDDFTFFFGSEAEAVAFATGMTDGNSNPVGDKSVITFDATPESVDAEAGSTFIIAPGMTLQAALEAASDGDTIQLSAGTYTLSGQLNIDKEVTIAGAGEGQTTIVTSDSAYGLHVRSDNVTLQDFTLDASALTTPGGYGVKVAPGGSATALTGFTAQDITVFGAARSEIDFNGVDDSSLIRVTVNGDPANGADGNGASAGVGIGLSDSTGITLEDITTLNNSWGSIGLYSAGRSYEPGTSDITFSGSYTHGEEVGIYADEELLGEERTVVETVDFSDIFDTVYKVQNSAWRDGSDGRSDDFTFFFGTEAEAVAFATGLTDGNDNPVGDKSVITTDETPADVAAEAGSTFYVYEGMSIQAAVDAASEGDTIVVAAGTYDEAVTISTGGLTLLGANAGVAGDDAARGAETVLQPSSGGFVIDIAPGTENVTIDGFSLEGSQLTDQWTTGIWAAGSGATITNTVLDTFNYLGIYTGDYSDAFNSPIDGVTVSDNLIRNMVSDGYGFGIYLQNTGADVTGNVTENVRNGLQVQPYGGEGIGGTVSGNSFEAYVTGIYYNYANSGTGDWQITGNTLTAGPVQEAGTNTYPATNWYGIAVQTQREGAGNVSFEGNTIDGAGFDGPGQSFGFDFREPIDASWADENIVFTGGSVDNVDEVSRNGTDDTFAFTTVDVSGRIFANGQMGGTDDDLLTGTADGDLLLGGAGDDSLIGDAGDDVIDGGAGLDVAIFSGSRADYTLTPNGTEVTLTGPDGTDILSDIEVIAFGSGSSTLLVGYGGFESIQAAVDAAKAGDTILVAPGAYDEDVLVDKDVTILGANAGVAFDGSRGAESVLTGSIRFATGSDGASVDGMQVSGGGSALGANFAVYVQAADISVLNTLLDRDASEGFGTWRGVVTAMNLGENLTVEGNAFSGWATGVYANPGATATISGNSFDGNNVAISTDGPDVVSIDGNSFLNAGFEHIGIGAQDDADLSGVIAANSFDGTGVPVTIYDLDNAGNTYVGTDGNDLFQPLGGTDVDSFDGGAGIDGIFAGARGTTQIVTDPSGMSVNDTLITNVEQVVFDDGSILTFLPKLADDETGAEDVFYSRDIVSELGVTAEGFTFSATGLPAGLSIDPDTGVISGTPTAGGTLSVAVTATEDATGLEYTDVFTMTLSDTNDAPTSTPIGAQTLAQGDALALDVSGSFADEEDGTPTLSATLANGDPLPEWLTFDGTSFSGTPENGDVGLLQVRVTGTDSGGLTTQRTFALTVTDVNDAPTTTGIADTTTQEESVFSLDVSGSFDDVDLGDSLSFSASGLPAGLSISPSGVISGTPDDAAVGTTTITVTAADEDGLTASASFELTVTNVNDVPTVTALADASVDEDAPVHLDVSGNFADLDGDALTFTASGLPAGLFITPEGVILGSVTDNAAVGTHNVTVTADDGNGGTVSDTFVLTVDNVNDAPVVASLIADQTPQEDSVFSLDVSGNFTDADGDALSYTAEMSDQDPLPAWLTFSNGVFSGTPRNADVGDIEVVVTASDGTTEVSATFLITVQNTNDGPVAVGAAIPAQTVDLDSALSDIDVSGKFTDPDVGDTLSYTLSGAPAGVTIDSGTGVISGTPTEAGDFTLAVTADDGNGGTLTRSFLLSVDPGNAAPTTTGFAAKEIDVKIGQSASDTSIDLNEVFSDVDGDALTFSVHSIVATNGTGNTLELEDVVINPDGTLTLSPDATFAPVDFDNGTYDIVIEASDGDASVSATLSLDVNLVFSSSDPDGVGFLSGGTIYFDSNNNGMKDAGEAETTLDGDGDFEFSTDDPVFAAQFGAILANNPADLANTYFRTEAGSGAVNLATGTVQEWSYATPFFSNGFGSATSSQVSPLTTLMALGISQTELKSRLDETVGVSAGVNLATLNYMVAALEEPLGTQASDDALRIAQANATIRNAVQLIADALSLDNAAGIATVYAELAEDLDAEAVQFSLAGDVGALIDDVQSATGASLMLPERTSLINAIEAMAYRNNQTFEYVVEYGTVPYPISDSGDLRVDFLTFLAAGQLVVDSGASFESEPEFLDLVAAEQGNVGSLLGAQGTSGDDDLTGDLGGTVVDTIDGGAGNDTITGGDGADDLRGGAGTDTLDYSDEGGANGVTVDLADGTATDTYGNSETVSGFENVVGTEGDDDITGDAEDNTIILPGTLDNDVVDGGAGTDTVDFSDLASGDVTITTGTDNVISVTDGTSTTTLENVEALSFSDTTIEAPTAIAADATTVTEGDDTLAAVTVTDGDDTAHSFSVSDTLADVDFGVDGSGNLVVTSGALDYETPAHRSFDVTVTATDADGLAYTETLSFTLNDVDEAPEGLIADQTTDEDAAFSLDLSTLIADPEDAGELNVEIVNGPEWLSIEPGTLNLIGTPDNGDVGSQAVTLRAYDGAGGTGQSTDFTFTLAVTNTNDAPVAQDVTGPTVAEGDSDSAQPLADDVDVSDTLTYTLGTVTVDGATQSAADAGIGFDGTNVTLDADVGLYDSLAVGETATVTVGYTVTDDSGEANDSDTGTVSFTVTGTNDGPTSVAIDPVSTAEEAVFSFDAASAGSFDDIDGDALTFSAQLVGGDPIPGWLSIDSTTGVLSGTPDDKAVGSLMVEVIASDGTLSTSQLINLEVKRVEDAPVVATPIPNAALDEGADASIDVTTGVFFDGDLAEPGSTEELTYTVSGLPTGLSFDGTTITGSVDDDAVGTHLITVTATDAASNAVSDQFVLTVNNVNDDPEAVGTIPDLSGNTATALNLDVTPYFADEDVTDTLTYVLSGHPPGMAIDYNTGVISGTPIQPGEFTITVTATDGNGGTAAQQQFTLDVSSLVVGTSADETLDGSFAMDEIRGLEGDDTLYGYGGEDTLFGGEGDDSLRGGAGDDTLDGGEGTDTADYGDAASGVTADLAAGTGTDGSGGTDSYTDIENLAGSAFGDVLTGDAGANLIADGDGNDTVDGGAGDDTVMAGRGNDVIEGGTGIDLFDASGQGASVVVDLGSNPISFIAPGEGFAVGDGIGFNGLSGIENLRGGGGSDELTGDAGDNTIFASGGNDTIDGGAGIDTYDASADDGDVVVNLVGGIATTSTLGVDSLSGIENVTTGAGDDNIEGDGLANVIDAGEGDNTVTSGLGEDVVTTGDGADSISTGADGDLVMSGGGNDIIDAGAGGNSVFGGAGDDSITAGGDNDSIDGGADDDIIDAGAGDNVVLGGAGDDDITTGVGADSIDGGADADVIDAAAGDNLVTGGTGDDTISTGAGADDIDGGADDDVIDAGDGANTVTGGDGDDSITTGAGDDSVDGGADADTIATGAGDDIILGGAGDDSIDGGEGIDTVVLEAASLADVTVDFANSTISSAVDGTDSFANIERFELGDGTVVRLVGAAGSAYSTIQDAIDAADAGDVIYVASGTYAEALTIDKGITLLGEDGDIQLDASGSLTGITITGGGEGQSVVLQNVDVLNAIDTGVQVDPSADYDSIDLSSVAIVGAGRRGFDLADGLGGQGAPNVDAISFDQIDVIEFGTVVGGAGVGINLPEYAGEVSITNAFLALSGAEHARYGISLQGLGGGTEGITLENVEILGDFVHAALALQDFSGLGAGDVTLTAVDLEGSVTRTDADFAMLYVDLVSGELDTSGVTIEAYDGAAPSQFNVGDGSSDMTGTDAGDSFLVTEGNVTVDGGAGDDVLVTGPGGADIDYEGGAGSDTLVIVNPASYEFDASFTLNATTLGMTANGWLAGSVGFSGIEALSVQMGDLGDSLYALGGVDLGGMDISITGGAGADDVDFSDATGLALEVSGGEGNDSLTGSAEGDTLSGDAGDDVIDGGNGENVIFGDTAPEREPGPVPLALEEPGPAASVPEGGDDTITTGDGADYIHGGAGDDSISAGAGANDIEGGVGNDTITTTGSDDQYIMGGDWTLQGEPFTGADNDSISTGDGDDEIYGWMGNDTITTTGGNNDIRAGSGDDSVTTGDGDDTISGGLGDDTIDAGEGNNDIYTGRYTEFDQETYEPINNDGSDDDVVTAGDGENYVTTWRGDDDVTLGDGDNDVYLGRGDDTLLAGDGENHVRGGNGNDSITLGDGDNEVYAGLYGGPNTAAYSEPDADTVTSGSGNDDITGGSDDDVIDAGDGDNYVDGDHALASKTVDGDDSITTGSGNDTIRGGGGNDTINAGTGVDEVLIDDSADNVTITHDANTGTTTIVSADGTDVMTGVDLIELNDATIGSVANDDTITTDEDTAVTTGNLLDNDFDIAGLGVTVISGDGNALSGGTVTFTTGQGAEVTLNSDGTYSYDPSGIFDSLNEGEDAPAADSFDYTITEADGTTATASVTIDLTGVNDAPVMGNDSTPAAVEDGAAITVDLSALGSDVDDENDGSSLTYAITTDLAATGEGGASISGTTLTFDPAGDFQDLSEGEERTVSVGITATDDQGATSDEGTVTVTVTGVNDGPTLAGGTLEVGEDTVGSMDLTLLGDDIDSEDTGDSLVYSIVGAPTKGLATISVDGDFLEFDSNGAFEDLDQGETEDVTVTVRATDMRGAFVDTEMTVTVTGANDAPVVTDTDEDGTTDVTEDATATAVLDLATITGDVDGDDDPAANITYTVDEAYAGGGSFSVDGTDLVFDPGSDFQDLNVGDERIVTISVTATDGEGDSHSADVSVRVTGTNDAPVLLPYVGGPATVSEDAVTPTDLFDLSGLALDVDNVGPDLTFSLESYSGPGVFALRDSSILTFDPLGGYESLALGESDTATIDVTVDDGSGGTDTFTYTATILGANDPLEVSAPVEATVSEDDGTVTFDVAALTANATDPDDSDDLAITGLVQTGGRSVTISDAGGISFDADAFTDLAVDESEVLTFTYDVTDGNGSTVTTSATITVNGVNDAPVISDIGSFLTANANWVTTGSQNVITEDVAAGYSGNAVVVFEDVDASDTASVSTSFALTGVAADQASAVQLQIMAAALQTTPTSGLSAPGFLSVPYSFNLSNAVLSFLGEGETAMATWTVTVADGNGGSDSHDFAIQLVGANDAPLAVDDSVTAVVGDAIDLTEAVLANDTDVDPNDILSVLSVDDSGATGTVTLEDGELVYTAGSVHDRLLVGETATDSFTYTVSDGQGGTDTATVDVTIQGSYAPDAVLTIGETEGGSFGNRFDGHSEPDGDVTFAFEGGTADLRLVLQGYDVDYADEVEVLLNGTQIGFLEVGPNEQLQLSQFGIDGDDLLDGINELTIRQNLNDTFIWGVTDLLLTDALIATDEDTSVTDSVLPDNPGGSSSVTGVNGTGAIGIPVMLASGALVTVQSDGSTVYDPNGAFDDLRFGQAASDSFTVTVDDGAGGTVEKTVLVDITGEDEVPVSAALTLDVTETGTFGHRYDGNMTPEGEVVFSFEGGTEDLYLSLQGYDVDYLDEVAVLLNGKQVGYLSESANNALSNSGFVLEVEDQLAGENRITFEQNLNDTFIWGVTDLLVSDNFILGNENIPVSGDVLPGAASETVTALNGDAGGVGTPVLLASGALVTLNSDGTLVYDANDAFDALGTGDVGFDRFDYTLSNGTTETVAVEITGVADPDVTLTRGTTAVGSFGNGMAGETATEASFGFEGTEDDLILTLLGFDIDYADEVEVLLNGSHVGFLEQTADNAFGGSTITLDADLQVDGENVLTFAQHMDDGFTWGVTDLLIT